MKNLNNQSGRSMIEMLGVLAIIGVLSVGGIAGYSKAMMKFKINKTLDQVAMTVTNIRTLYAQQGNYAGLNNSLARQLGLVDDAMKGTSSGSLKSPFGPITISLGNAALIDASGETNTAFQLKLDNLPVDACVAIATNAWGSAYSAGFLGVGVGAAPTACTTRSASTATTGGVACSSNNTTSAAQLMSVATAATECAKNSGINSVYVKYY